MASIEESIEVEVPVATAYNQWTQFEDFPRFMEGVRHVRQVDDEHLHWVVEHNGHRHEFDTTITEQRPDERVAWNTTAGTAHAGAVTFHRLDDSRCKVMVQIDWQPGGILEELGAALGSDDRRVRSDLMRFKEMIESRGAETGAWRGSIEHGDAA